MAKSPMGEMRFFDALDALTFNEMLSVAGLIALHLGDGEIVDVDANGVAHSLANASESWRETDGE